MKKIQKKNIALTLLVVLVGILFWWYIDRPDRYNYINDRPLVAITIDNISDYFKPNTKINTLEPEQLVEIEGRIKEINTNRHISFAICKRGRKKNLNCSKKMTPLK